MCQTKCFANGVCERTFFYDQLPFWLDKTGTWWNHLEVEMRSENDCPYWLPHNVDGEYIPLYKGLPASMNDVTAISARPNKSDARCFFKGDCSFELDNHWHLYPRWRIREYHQAEIVIMTELSGSVGAYKKYLLEKCHTIFSHNQFPESIFTSRINSLSKKGYIKRKESGNAWTITSQGSKILSGIALKRLMLSH